MPARMSAVVKTEARSQDRRKSAGNGAGFVRSGLHATEVGSSAEGEERASRTKSKQSQKSQVRNRHPEHLDTAAIRSRAKHLQAKVFQWLPIRTGLSKQAPSRQYVTNARINHAQMGVFRRWRCGQRRPRASHQVRVLRDHLELPVVLA
jgi:hypothetical protein